MDNSNLHFRFIKYATMKVNFVQTVDVNSKLWLF